MVIDLAGGKINLNTRFYSCKQSKNKQEQDEGKTEYQSLTNWGSQWLSTGGR
jgi:hypothetical protein